jgi:hypothetical protein
LSFTGPFTFTYNRGHGECKNPVSNIESCTEDSRMLLSFQACPDVSGTESTGKRCDDDEILIQFPFDFHENFIKLFLPSLFIFVGV